MTVGDPTADDGAPGGAPHDAADRAAGVADEEAASPLPPLADGLMAPLLDAGAEVLRRLPPADLPPAARRLRAFDRRGLATPAARHQLRRLLEDDEELLGAAATVLLARPEAAQLVEAWRDACASGGGAPLTLVAETAADGRLALLASVLAAGLPTGFEFGLGLVVATAATADREGAAAQAVRAASAGQAAAEEARRRADAARSVAEAEAARLDAALREERHARRELEQHATEAAVASGGRSADLEAALTGAEQRAAAAEQRSQAAEQRTQAAEQRAASAERTAAEAQRRALTAEQDLAETERRAASAEQELSEGSTLGTRPLGDVDAEALDQVARAAEDLAAALRRLASGPPRHTPAGAPGAVSGRPWDGTAGAPATDSHLSPETTTAGPAAGSRRPTPAPAGRRLPGSPGSGKGAVGGLSGRRPGGTARRAAVQIPPGMQQDDPAAVAAMVRTPGVAVIVDGYNVSMLAWPDTTAAVQRDRLCDALAELQLRVRCEVTVVFDGADVPGVRPLRRRGIRVVFSAPGQEADEVIVDEVVFRPPEVPVIVVTSDREVRTAAEAEGASVLPADRFLQLMRR